MVGTINGRQSARDWTPSRVDSILFWVARCRKKYSAVWLGVFSRDEPGINCIEMKRWICRVRVDPNLQRPHEKSWDS